MAFNTGNAVGSTDPRDLSDNAENLDRFANGTNAAYNDRLGVSRKSLAGMESDFATDQSERATTFANFLASSGYVGTGTGGAIEDYAGGIEITEYNQLIRESGEFYRAKASLSLPYTTTGTWVGDDETRFVSVGDAALRQEIGSGIFRADSPANLESTNGRFDGDAARLVSGTGRDGDFRWDSSDLSSTLVLASATSDSVDDTTDTINDADHPFVNGDGVITQTTVNGLTSQTVYWVVNSTAGTYQLSALPGGSPIDLTGTTNVTVDKLLDPLQYTYVTPSSDRTGASGSWARQDNLPAKFVRPYQSLEVDVLIVYGQSNARGYAANSPGAPEYKVPLARVWDGSALQEITSYTPTANDGTSTGSAWLAFANEYCKETSRHLVVLNAAKGSQAIADLQKGTANYTALDGWFTGAISALSLEGSSVGRVMVAFNQGESDSSAGAGTAPVTYYNALGTLWTDLKTDFGAEIMGLFTVGYYADSRLIEGQVIQQAQRLFARDNADVVLAYDNLGGFGSHNGLKVDSVHYNQRGYNIMGREGAKAVMSALFPDTEAPASDALIKRFGSLTMNQSQAWNLHSAVVRKQSDSDWVVNHTTPFASSLIVSATAESDRLKLKLATPARTIMSFSANFGGTDLHGSKWMCAIEEGTNPASGIAGSIDADGYSYADVFFSVDVYLQIDMGAQTVSADIMGSAIAVGLLEEVSVTFPSTGRADITHGSAGGLSQGSIKGGTARSLRVNAAETLTILQARDSADALVNDVVTVLIPNMKVKPSSIINNADLSVQIISADYAVW